eukprot:14954980-Heterocapsa_arctica.AAC.1
MTVRWQCRPIDCQIQDVRQYFTFWTIMTAPTASSDTIRKYVNSTIDATFTTACVFGPAGWVLSEGGQQHPALFHVLLRVAQCDLHVVGCCGGRVGRGVVQVS